MLPELFARVRRLAARLQILLLHIPSSPAEPPTVTPPHLSARRDEFERLWDRASDLRYRSEKLRRESRGLIWVSEHIVQRSRRQLDAAQVALSEAAWLLNRPNYRISPDLVLRTLPDNVPTAEPEDGIEVELPMGLMQETSSVEARPVRP